MSISYLERLQEQAGEAAAQRLRDFVETAPGHYYRHIAQLILASPDLAERKKKNEWEYKSIADLAAEALATDSPLIALYEVVGLASDRPLSSIDPRAFLDAASKQYGRHINDWLLYVPEGLELHTCDEAGSFRVATEEDRSFRLVSTLIDNSIDLDPAINAPPQWAIDLHLWRPNFDAYKAIYFDLNLSDPLYEYSKRVRREAVLAATRGRLGELTGPAELPQELGVALEAFNAVYGNRQLLERKTPKQAIVSWLKDRHPQLSEGALERISTVANWQPTGGAPRQG